MDNYSFCVEWVLSRQDGGHARVLDYGCGAGEIVRNLRRNGVEASGCDVFFGGGDHSSSIDSSLFANGVIRAMKGNVIPFDSTCFDLIVNNQVIEHVEDLDVVLSEIRRVLKPEGTVLSLFPYHGAWREAHCGVPFLHRFRKGGRIRVYYAALLRSLGLGYHKKGKNVLRWSRDSCAWLDRWTYYRTKQEIETTYSRYFGHVAHIEDYWLQQRLGRLGLLTVPLPRSVRRLVARKLGNMVIEARGFAPASSPIAPQPSS